jgi:hypothetical protein
MRRLFWFTLILSLGLPGAAHAFCGFYVSGAGADMFNNATQVTLMREGTRTVLAMQNNYQGPPSDFAMVVPVPVVLQKENVKTLDRGVFQRVDEHAAPRLVEYWEQDPCMQVREEVAFSASMGAEPPRSMARVGGARDLGVTIEAQFTVGEYQIVILSARDSTGLDTWLRQEKYTIPQGAEPLLRPYVEAGSKFFVAKVDVEKVRFKDGMAELSPLRFHYDSEEFSLPVRLGMINSAGTQDLIVHILARGKRYEVANYPNVTIPTNLDVTSEVRERFGEFYAALLDATLERNPGAVVTEYSWDASSCDPCPTPPLAPGELATLGEDVLHLPAGGAGEARKAAPAQPAVRARWGGDGFVLTRLHARYGKDALANDLVFKEAGPIVGGREFKQADGKLEQGARPGPINNFQARYAIRHEWTGAIACDDPRRGIWGGPPPGSDGSSSPRPALDLAFAPRGQVELAALVAGDVPEIALVAAPGGSQIPGAKSTPSPKTIKSGCGCQSTGSLGGGALILVIAALCLGRVRRRS